MSNYLGKVWHGVNLPDDRLLDPNNHHADAVRYAMQRVINQEKPKMDDYDPLKMIALRLHKGRIPMGVMWSKLTHISAHVTDKVAIVFVVDKNNKPVTITDDPELFPSDTLIAQIRILNQ